MGPVDASAVEEGMCARVRASESGKMSCRCRAHAVADVGSRMPGEPSGMQIVTHRMDGASVCDVSVYDVSTVRNERLVVVHNPAVTPIASPVIPTPAIAAEPANAET